MTLADMQTEGAEAGEEPTVAGSKVVASDSRQPQIHVSVLPPARNEKGSELRERVAASQYDTDAWAELAQEAQGRPISEASAIYEQLLSVFPTSAPYWRLYAEAHMDVGDDEAVKAVFSRCLPLLRDLDLWRSYLRYITLTNEDRGGPGIEDIRKAYDFSLQHIGQDVSAAPLWQQYIAFVKKTAGALPSDETRTAGLLRPVYQAAVVIPMHGVEGLWRDYEAFENETNKQSAKVTLAEFQPRHAAAKAALRERKPLTDGLARPALAVPPRGMPREAQQLAAWKQLLAFERANPQRLNPTTLAKRVTFAHEQCLLYLYHYADPWFEYAAWTAEHDSPEAAARVYERALRALPASVPLHYAFAELEELRGNGPAAKALYRSLLDKEETASALGHIQLMRFVQRTEGMAAARKVFLTATKSPACTHHVFVASAKLELAANKDPKTARNIFEYGLKKYLHEPEYVLQYIDFLQHQNDDTNVRVLFERALNAIAPAASAKVWARFVQFEATYGDLSSLLKVEKRRREAAVAAGERAEDGLEALVRRYRFMDLWPAAPHELALMHPHQAAKSDSPLPASSSGRFENGGSVGPPLPHSAAAHASASDYQDGGLGEGPSPPLNPRETPTGQPQPSRQQPGDGLAAHRRRKTPPRPPPGPPPEARSTPPPLPAGLPPTASFVSRPSSTPAAPVPQFLVDALVQQLPPLVLHFLHQIPPLHGPAPDVDMVIAALLSTDFSSPPEGPPRQPGEAEAPPQPAGVSSPGQKRKQPDLGSALEDSTNNQSRPPPRDVFRLRQLQRAKAASSIPGGTSSAGTMSTGSRSGSH
ncbi:cleavage stimulation factor subunit 3 [Klebsormidium nitens]|uniref:Cleavage stimulation factor subunit 3 n=1 Tax=Klebsormidium nitens TaxID=105231 RepID=A0A1Y1I9U8_KLENI|nr:cleavage stimulation factor subunit 3 [Klebsormidium nitens]|eukprot:GAQ84868.1 cleavage stimulation factor subunit 3 [Klebsormidium nitens]